MTVVQLIDALTRLMVHGQIKGNSEVRFSNPKANYELNGIFCSLENGKVYLTCIHQDKKGDNREGVYTEN